MAKIVIVDTTVFLNILNVPGRNQDRPAVIDEFRSRLDAGDHLYLPLACIIETGNHIARLSDGHARIRFASEFSKQVVAAIEEQAPWKLVPNQLAEGPQWPELRNWLVRFVDDVAGSVGMTDVIVKDVFERFCRRFSMSHVSVWSLDDHLVGLDRPAS